MKSLFRNEEGGVMLVELVLLAVVLAAAAFAGYQYFSNRGSVNQATKPKPHTVAKSSPSPSSTPAASGVVTISDWGVKFQLVSSLINTEVIFNKQSSSDQPPQVSYALTTSRVEALGGNCSSTDKQFGDIVVLQRYSAKPVATPDGELINNAPINGYYYAYTSPSASCSGLGVKPESNVEAQDRDAIKASLKTLTAG